LFCADRAKTGAVQKLIRVALIDEAQMLVPTQAPTPMVPTARRKTSKSTDGHQKGRNGAVLALGIRL